MLRRWLIAIAALASLLAALPAVADDQAATIYAVTSRTRLVTFNADAPGTILNDVPIVGLNRGDRLVGIDVCPADGNLYGVGLSKGSGTIYRIDPWSGQATMVAPISEALTGKSFGLDFNPVVDRLRVVSDARQNLRIVPDTGVATVDGMLSFNSYRTPEVVGAAYTNSFAGTTATQLFNIEHKLDLVTLQNPPNNGTLSLIGFLGPDTKQAVGFDILSIPPTDPMGTPTNVAYATLSVDGQSRLVTIDLTTGAATDLGAVGSDKPVSAIAVDS